MKNNTPVDLGLEVPVVKPRNPWKALLLAMFTPGVGQLYNGQWKKGLLFAAIILSSTFVIGIAHTYHSFNGMLTHLTVYLLVYLYTIIDAVRYARRQAYYIPKPYNNRTLYVVALIGSLGISALTNLLPVVDVQNFIIPTPSNEPTMMAGDWVMADIKAYKGKTANYGDLAVFKRKGEFRFYRIVGLPGDQLDIRRGQLTINGKPATTRLIRERLTDERIPVLEYEETLPGGHKQHIYISVANNNPDIDSMHVAVPADSYYVMGDSRDNALDSRYEGPVAGDSLVGRVLYSYWGKTTDRINVDLR